MAVKGLHRVSGRSTNYKGSENVITNGSVVAVADGQCMIIVDQGKVTELCAEPGEFVYDLLDRALHFLRLSRHRAFLPPSKTSASASPLAASPRRTSASTTSTPRRLIGNKYGTPSPVPFRVVDQRAGIDIDISLRCFGEYSYRICRPDSLLHERLRQRLGGISPATVSTAS